MLRRLLITLTALLLVACAGTPLSKSTTANDLDGKAVVVFSVSHDLEVGSKASAIFYLNNNDYGNRAILKSLDRTYYVPSSSDFKTRHGHLYVLELAPGRHQFDLWQVAGSGSGSRLFPNPTPSPLTFEVRKGQVLYLGNLHTQIVMGRGLGLFVPAQATPYVVDKQAEDVELAEQRIPAVRGKVAVALLPIGPWTATGETTRRNDPLVIPPPLKK